MGKLDCNCGHAKSEHNEIGCGYSQCSCKGFEEKKTKDSSKVTQTIETIGKLSVDEEKLRKKFKDEGRGRMAEVEGKKTPTITKKTDEWEEMCLKCQLQPDMWCCLLLLSFIDEFLQ